MATPIDSRINVTGRIDSRARQAGRTRLLLDPVFRVGIATKVERLRATRLFAGRSGRELHHLARHLDEGTYRQGATLTREGAMPTTFAVILEGQVVISVAGRTVGRLGPGDCLGYEAMREAAPAERTARALTDVRVMVASRSQFRAFAALTLA